MTTIWNTHSEGLFCHVCEERLGYDIQKIPESQAPSPDYEIHADGIRIVAEVKELSDNAKNCEIQNALEESGHIHIGNVDFEFTGALDRVLRKQKRQLEAEARSGTPTLGVIYVGRFLGPTEYQIRHQLHRGAVSIPSAISAIMLMKHSGIMAEETPTPLYLIFCNPNATVIWPVDIFPEIFP